MMLFMLLLAPLWHFIEFLLGLIPDDAVTMPSWYESTVWLLQRGLAFFPPDVYLFVIGNLAFWMGVHMLWAIIEWVYKKIPGVD